MGPPAIGLQGTGPGKMFNAYGHSKQRVQYTCMHAHIHMCVYIYIQKKTFTQSLDPEGPSAQIEGIYPKTIIIITVPNTESIKSLYSVLGP